MLALLNRRVVEQRDFCDLFLFSSSFLTDSAERIATKLKMIGCPRNSVVLRMRNIREARNYHVRAIDEVIAKQLDRPVAESLRQAGGAAMIFDSVYRLLVERLNLVSESMQ